MVAVDSATLSGCLICGLCLGITLFSCIVQHVIPWAPSTPLSFNVSVLEAIEQGILAPNRSYEWRHQCLAALFDLCRQPHQPEDKACLAVTSEVSSCLVWSCIYLQCSSNVVLLHATLSFQLFLNCKLHTYDINSTCRFVSQFCCVAGCN